MLRALVLAAPLVLAACADDPNLGQPGYVQGFAGAAVADEPHAALAGRDILSEGGLAGDAAAAMFLALAVTKPASAGLMASGVCLGYDPADDTHRAYRFQTPEAVRAFAAIHARFGRLPWRQTVGRAEAMARFGVRLSKTFVGDWRRSPPQDEQALAVYGAAPAVGDSRQNLELASLLGQIRLNGAGALYTGAAAATFWSAMEAAGLPVDRGRWRDAVPTAADSARVRFGNDDAVFPPFPGTAGETEAAIWPLLEEQGSAALPRLLADAGATAGGGDAETAFVAVDGLGGAVACTVTMGRPFGTGRMVSGVFMAEPDMPVGGPVLVTNKPTSVLLAAAAGAGTPGWAPAVALETLDNDRPLANAVAMPRTAPASSGGMTAEAGAPDNAIARAGTLGRINAVICRRGLPNYPESCEAVADPRSTGLAAPADSPG